ncbi:hypothetical protein HDU92_004498 [Lobulomyces angularis]|nr:hypothetical protein HDU92_004498 [Lobulomyces angularis]
MGEKIIKHTITRTPDVVPQTLVLLMDSYDSNRSLFEITDSKFMTIDIIHIKNDHLPQQMANFDRMNKKDTQSFKHHIIDEILYEHYYTCIKEIQNKTTIGAIAMSSRKESLVEISARLRVEFAIPVGTDLACATLFVDKHKMKQKVLEKNIVTALMSDAVLSKGNELIKKTGFPVVLKPTKETGSKGVQIIRNRTDFELQLKDIQGKSSQYILEQYIDGDLYRVDGSIENGEIKFFAAFHENPSNYEYFTNRLPLAEVLVKDQQEKKDMKKIANEVITAFKFLNGVFHLELLKNKIDKKFYFLEIAARPGGGAARTIMARHGADLTVQMIRLESGLKGEFLDLPDELHFASVSFLTPDRNKTFIFDSINLPEKVYYKTLKTIDAPCGGKIMGEYDAVNIYFTCTDEKLLLQEVNKCKESLKVTYRSKSALFLPPEVSKGIDLRSDTLTTQSEGMRLYMLNASMGDDCFGENTTVAELEKYCAKLVGKEAAIFVPTGTMTNQIAIRAHTRPGDEVILDACYHINFYESAPTAAFGHVSTNLIRADRGIFSVKDIQKVIDSKPRGPLYSKTKLILLENTINAGGGAVLPLENLEEIKKFADTEKFKIHMDGARLLNASVAAKMKPSELAKYADSVGICFAKGLGAPFGSILCGDREFIDRAKIYRKWFGGALHQAGFMAAAAQYSLNEDWENILQRDHDNAKFIESALQNILPIEKVTKVETNIVIVDLDGLCEKMEMIEALRNNGVLAFPWCDNKIRFITSRNVASFKEINTATDIICETFKQFIKL